MLIERKPEFFKGAQLKVGIIGCGYVGLPLAVEYAKAGFSVTGIDVLQAKVDGLNRGESHVQDVPDSEIERLIVASAMMCGPKRLRFGPRFEGEVVLPHRVGRIERVVFGLGAFKQVEFDEAGHLIEMSVA